MHRIEYGICLFNISDSINSHFTPTIFIFYFIRSWERHHVFLWIFYVKHLLLFHVPAFSYVCINARYISLYMRFLAPICDIYNVRHQLNFYLDEISKRKYILSTCKKNIYKTFQSFFTILIKLKFSKNAKLY